MILLPRFKYFLSIRDLTVDFITLLFSDMNNTNNVKPFEDNLAQYFDKNYCTTFSSFRMGLYYYLKSLKLNQGDEILLSPITIADTVNVILTLGLTPKFVDIDEDTHSLCLDSLKSHITENTKCLLITYLSGISGLDGEIKKICDKNGTTIIEDISQSYGSKSPIGNSPFLGDVLIGSLSSGKIISTYTGGFLVSNNEQNILEINREVKLIAPPKTRFIFEILSNLKIVIATSKLVFPFVYFILLLFWKTDPKGPVFLTRKKIKKTTNDVFANHQPISRNELPKDWFTYLNSWQAKVGMRFLRNIEKINQRRRERAELLFTNLNEEVKRDIPKLAINNKNNNFYHLPIKTGRNKTNRLKSFFMKGIDSEGYGLNLCSEEDIFKDIKGDCPKALKVKHQSIFLPLHESFSKKSIIEMANSLNNIYKTQKRD